VTRALVSIVATVVVVVASGSAAPAAERGAGLTRVKIGVLPLEPTALAFYAHHRSYFRRQRIDAGSSSCRSPRRSALRFCRARCSS